GGARCRDPARARAHSRLVARRGGRRARFHARRPSPRSRRELRRLPVTDAAGDCGPIPWLPEGRTKALPGRSEVFFRQHHNDAPDAPTVLLLHGWTASADLQFFTSYPALAEMCSFVAPDHRGHGRGARPTEPFELEDAADD